MKFFNDRIDAGHQLSKVLKKYQNQKDSIVIAIPRGGVKIGAQVAKELSLPLDVFFTKKIGHPYNREFAIGVISKEKELINEALVKSESISSEYLNDEIKRIRSLLISKEQIYREKFSPLNLKNKTVIIVDDGVATGNTLILTIRLIRLLQPKKVIVAIPVGPKEAENLIKSEADEVFFLYSPEDFWAISQFYEDFKQVEDSEAIELLKEHHGPIY